jgi:hypothetical protein
MKPKGTECVCRIPAAGCGGGGRAGGGGLARGGGGTWADKAVDADKPRTQYDKLKC